MLTFPAQALSDRNFRRGSGDLYIGTYVAAGADATDLRHVGMTKGDFEFDPKMTFHDFEGDQALGPVGTMRTKEAFTFKFTVLDLTLKNLQVLLGLPITRITGGDRTDNAGTLLMGEEASVIYNQWVWRGLPPPQSSATSSVVQIFKGVVTNQGAIKFSKTGESAMQLTVNCYTDLSITTLGRTLKWYEG
jgi:hypothetical protein